MIQFKGGNGSSKEEAIIILGTNNEIEGVDAEYEYIENKLEEFEIESLTFIGEVDKKYDVLDIKLADGIKMEIYFDITDFYDKK